MPNKAIFWISYVLMSHGSFVRCNSPDRGIKPSAPTITGTVNALVFHILLISISKSLYLESFSAVLVDVFLSDGTAISISMVDFPSLSLIMISGLFALISLSVMTGISHRMVILSFSVTVSGSWLKCFSLTLMLNC